MVRMEGGANGRKMQGSSSKNFLFLVLATGCCSSVESQWVWENKPMCPTGELQRVLIDTSTGNWKFVDDPDDVESINYEENLLSDFNTRRMLRKGSEGLGSRQLPEDPLQIEHLDVDWGRFHRFMSTDGSNSMTTTESANGNVEDTNTVMILARPCGCVEQENSRYALCPENSDSCSFDDDLSAKCHTFGRIDVIARNLFPLLWLWYCTIFLTICCTFQGRIILDYIRGTILYSFCGVGDSLENRETRDVNGYNLSIVEEILNEERLDRQEGRRRRNNSSVASRQMNDIAANGSNYRENGDTDQLEQGVPPTIVTSREGESTNDADTGGGANSSRLLMDRLIQRFRNVVWPWQTSWKRYIKYNLLLRVEWIAMRDEVAFIESRQERGLPHARYEMKTRRWNAATDVCSCSIEPSSLANSLDVPHCTICFTELEDGDRVGDLGCPHVFHADCLKMWVTKRNSCPLCNIPIARRKRISSDELVKEDVCNQNSNVAEVESEAHANPGLPLANNTDTNPSSYDHTLPPVEGYYGSPSNQQRRGPNRLSHMLMTPSTVAASNYSEEEDFEDLDVEHLSREGDSPSQGSSEEDISPPNTRRAAHIDAERIWVSEIQEADDESDIFSDNPSGTTTRDTSLDAIGCNINDYLERDNTSQGGDIDIPSPPRRIRRRIEENESQVVDGMFASNQAPSFPHQLLLNEDELETNASPGEQSPQSGVSESSTSNTANTQVSFVGDERQSLPSEPPSTQDELDNGDQND